jgi:hypothetical protein
MSRSCCEQPIKFDLAINLTIAKALGKTQK